ncbi:hypothetical protein MMC29_002081 [Sticta canariensis]|nr:hypothetical protein [Sticta canariensis]
MDDPDDVILYLLPHKSEGFDGAAFATAMPENKSRFLAGRGSDALKPPKIPHRQERGGTELPVERGLLENTDCLVVRFSQGARTRVGVVAGLAAHADLTIQKIPGISTFHLAFTFDDQYRPIVRDLGSTGGTKVTYNEEEAERLSNFDWLLQGPSIARGKPPVLNITDLVQFKVIVPPRDITSPDYIDRVKRFRMGTADPDELFASFIIQSAQGTRLPPPADSLREESRRGRLWDSEIRVECDDWRRPHIVTFRDATFSPWPKLKFEYVPGGSLDAYHDLSNFESTQVLCQLSSVLEYLHNLQPSVAHRDIKPANILVEERGVNGIYVKLSDFGISKAADTMKTWCGTRDWEAPELYLKAADRKGTANDKYGVGVDIWSLGVVVASLECGGLPEFEGGWESDAVAWIHALRKHVEYHYQQQGSKLLFLILDNMLVEDPEERSSADYCHDEALKLLQGITDTRRQESDGDYDDGSTTPKAPMLVAQSIVESESADSEASTIRLDIQPASSADSEARIIETVEDIDPEMLR